jgi:hypothetical protein
MVRVLDFSAYPLGSIAFFSFARPPFYAHGRAAGAGRSWVPALLRKINAGPTGNRCN